VYAYAGNDPVNATDPTGLAKAVPDEAYYMWMYRGVSGSDHIDFDNNGLDDLDEFADYAWGWYRFRTNGGTIDQYHTLQFLITYGLADAGATAAAREAVYFGRFRVGDIGGGRYAEYDPTTGMITTNTNSCMVDPSIGLPISIFSDRNPMHGAFILAHELHHFAGRLQGTPYVPDPAFNDADPVRERNANCSARRAVGAVHPNVAFRCW
jgi:hypothetical protein